jgi:hypothetical protein
MTTRDELIQLIDDLPAEDQAQLVERLKTQRNDQVRQRVHAAPGAVSRSETESRISVSWDTIGPASFGAAVLVGFTAGSLGGQFGPLLAVIGALVGLLIGSVIDRRVASVEP